MNDHEAIDAITEALDRYYQGGVHDWQTLYQIIRIIGANKISHEEAKEERS